MKYSKYITIILGMAIMLQCPQMVCANLTNGGFETGDFAEWRWSTPNPPLADVVGYEYPRDFLPVAQPPYTTNSDGDRAWLPTEGQHFLSLKSTDGAGTDTTSIRRDIGSYETTDVLSFDFFFDFGNNTPDDGGHYDYAMVSLAAHWGFMGMANWHVDILRINFPGVWSDPIYLDSDENIGWSSFSYTLGQDRYAPNDAGYSLSLSVGDFGGFSESIFGIDNIKVEPGSVIPAPSAVSLSAIGVGLAGWLKRRRAL